MLGTIESKQSQVEMVNIEMLVPKNHLLRKIDVTFDFEIIREKCRHLYCENNGRPSIDPVVLFKALFIGYLYGIRSERQLVKEIEVNMAYRWFLGLGITEKVMNHSTFSQNRIRRFNGTGIFEELFNETVHQSINKGLVDGKVLYTDSTHIKANANKKKFTKEKVSRETRKYFENLDEAVNHDRIAHNKKPLKPKEDTPKVEMKEIKVNKTDPDSGYLMRKNKPEYFAYLDHRTVDGKHNFITDVYISPGNVSDNVYYLSILDKQISKFDFNTEVVVADAAYNTLGICNGLIRRGLTGLLGNRRLPGKKDIYRKRDFVFDSTENVIICPQGQKLKYNTTNRNGNRTYLSDPKQCRTCSMLHKCTKAKDCIKRIDIHIYQQDKDKIKANMKAEVGRALYNKRKERIERSFADAKELHGYRYAKFRGIQKVQDQSYMTAATQNIKKMSLMLTRKPRTGDDNNDGRQRKANIPGFLESLANFIYSITKDFLLATLISTDFPISQLKLQNES